MALVCDGDPDHATRQMRSDTAIDLISKGATPGEASLMCPPIANRACASEPLFRIMVEGGGVPSNGPVAHSCAPCVGELVDLNTPTAGKGRVVIERLPRPKRGPDFGKPRPQLPDGLQIH